MTFTPEERAASKARWRQRQKEMLISLGGGKDRFSMERLTNELQLLQELYEELQSENRE